MPEPALITVFGTGVTQNISTLTINKEVLYAKTSLSPKEQHTAEALVVALIQLWQDSLNDTTQADNLDQSVSVALQTTPTITNRGDSTFLRHTFTVEVDRVLGRNELDVNPNNY